MELYIGGYAQGKLSYVSGKYPKALIVDERDFEWYIQEKKDCRNSIILNHFHLCVKDLLAKGNSVEKIQELIDRFVDRMDNDKNRLMIICDEIGNGIVPMEKEERIYREETGRLLIRIATKATSVERVLCGIAQKIK